MTQKKITLFVPEELLLRAQKQAGGGISDTVRKGLELLAASNAYHKLKSLRGKLKLKIDIEELRRDRKW